MSGQSITDVDGVVYAVTWADDTRSAEVTGPNGVLCIVYAVRRGTHTVWYSTDTDDAHSTPFAAIMATTAQLRMNRGAQPPVDAPPSPTAKPKVSWRDLVPAKEAPPKPLDTKWHHRKDWD